jgi:WD40 repeat protein
MFLKTPAQKRRRKVAAALVVALVAGGFFWSRRETWPARHLEKSALFLPGTPIKFDPSPLDAASIQKVKLLGRIGMPDSTYERHLDFSNNRKFAAVRDDSTLNVVDLQTGKVLQSLEGNFFASAVSNDGTKVAAWGDGVWLVEGSVRRLLKCRNLEDGHLELMFSDDESRIAVWRRPGGCVFDTKTLARRELPLDAEHQPTAEFFVRDSTNESLYQNDAKTSATFQRGRYPREQLTLPKKLAWVRANDQRSVVIGAVSGEIHRWDRPSKQWSMVDSELTLCPEVPFTECAAPEISSDAKYLTWADSKSAYFVETETGKTLWTSSLRDAHQLFVGNDQVLAVTETESLVALDRRTGKRVWAFPRLGTPIGATPTQVDFDSMSMSLATGRRVDSSVGARERYIAGYLYTGAQVEGLQVRGEQSATIAHPIEILAFGKSRQKIEGRVIQSIAIHPNKREFLVGQANGSLERFDVETARPLGIVASFPEPPITVAYNATGGFAVGFSSAKVGIYDSKGKRTAEWKSTREIRNVALSNDGKVVALGTSERTADNRGSNSFIEVLDAADGTLISQTVSSNTYPFAFATDSKSIVSAEVGEIVQFDLNGTKLATKPTVAWTSNIEATARGFSIVNENGLVERVSPDLKTSTLSTEFVTAWKGTKPYRYVTEYHQVVIEPSGSQSARNIKTEDAEPVVMVRARKILGEIQMTSKGKTQSALQIFDMATGKSKTIPLPPSKDKQLCGLGIHVTPDEKTVNVTGCGTTWVLNPDFTVRKTTHVGPGFGPVPNHDLTYSPDGRMFAVSDSSEIQFFATDTGKRISSTTIPYVWHAFFRFSSDGSYFAVNSNGGTVGVYGVPLKN